MTPEPRLLTLPQMLAWAAFIIAGIAAVIGLAVAACPNPQVLP